MKSIQSIPEKIYNIHSLKQEVKRWRLKNKRIAFTNGVFDMLHEGHVSSLAEAASTADILVVGINSDASVQRLKGENRPVISQDARALILASLVMTDAVIVFNEDTPKDLIVEIMPDVLVKGGDYKTHEIAGATEVISNGGTVKLAKLVEGVSTTLILKKLRDA